MFLYNSSFPDTDSWKADTEYRSNFFVPNFHKICRWLKTEIASLLQFYVPSLGWNLFWNSAKINQRLHGWLQLDELRRGSSLSSWCHLNVSILVTLVDVRQNGCICHCCEGNNDVFESLFPLRDIEHWCRQTCSLSSSFGTVSQDKV